MLKSLEKKFDFSMRLSLFITAVFFLCFYSWVQARVKDSLIVSIQGEIFIAEGTITNLNDYIGKNKISFVTEKERKDLIVSEKKPEANNNAIERNLEEEITRKSQKEEVSRTKVVYQQLPPDKTCLFFNQSKNLVILTYQPTTLKVLFSDFPCQFKSFDQERDKFFNSKIRFFPVELGDRYWTTRPPPKFILT